MLQCRRLTSKVLYAMFTDILYRLLTILAQTWQNKVIWHLCYTVPFPATFLDTRFDTSYSVGGSHDCLGRLELASLILKKANISQILPVKIVSKILLVLLSMFLRFFVCVKQTKRQKTCKASRDLVLSATTFVKKRKEWIPLKIPWSWKMRKTRQAAEFSELKVRFWSIQNEWIFLQWNNHFVKSRVYKQWLPHKQNCISGGRFTDKKNRFFHRVNLSFLDHAPLDR